MDSLLDSLIDSFAWLSPEWLVFVLAMLPLIELRLAIPVGLAMGLDPFTTLFFALLGNGLPILPIVYLLPVFFNVLYKIKFLQPFMDKVINKARERGKAIEKKGALGLILFVGIPLPGTGVWTGCLLSYLLGLRKTYAIVSIFIGMVIAGVLFTLSGAGLMQVFKVVAGIEYILLALVVIGLLWYIYKKKKNKKL